MSTCNHNWQPPQGVPCPDCLLNAGSASLDPNHYEEAQRNAANAAAKCLRHHWQNNHFAIKQFQMRRQDSHLAAVVYARNLVHNAHQQQHNQNPTLDLDKDLDTVA